MRQYLASPENAPRLCVVHAKYDFVGIDEYVKITIGSLV